MILKLKKYYAFIQANNKDDSSKDIFKQLFEILVLFFIRRIGPGYYLMARMYKSDRGWDYILGFINPRKYIRRVFELNNRLYQRCSQNKCVEKAILTTYGLPTPEILGHFHSENGFTVDGERLRDKAALKALINNQEIGSKLCFKLVQSWGGQGFRAIECLVEGNIKDMSNGHEMNFDIFFETLKSVLPNGLIIERYLIQHSDYSIFNKSSVNTVRVMVKKNANGFAKCFGAFLKIGRDGSLIDNGAAGGIMVCVDIETGILDAGRFSSFSDARFDKHPDNSTLLKGTQLPMYKEIFNIAEETLLAFPETRFAGVDVAYSKQGPVILEMNVQPDYIDFALIETPTQQALS